MILAFKLVKLTIYTSNYMCAHTRAYTHTYTQTSAGALALAIPSAWKFLPVQLPMAHPSLYSGQASPPQKGVELKNLSPSGKIK